MCKLQDHAYGAVERSEAHRSTGRIGSIGVDASLGDDHGRRPLGSVGVGASAIRASTTQSSGDGPGYQTFSPNGRNGRASRNRPGRDPAPIPKLGRDPASGTLCIRGLGNRPLHRASSIGEEQGRVNEQCTAGCRQHQGRARPERGRRIGKSQSRRLVSWEDRPSLPRQVGCVLDRQAVYTGNQSHEPDGSPLAGKAHNHNDDP